KDEEKKVILTYVLDSVTANKATGNARNFEHDYKGTTPWVKSDNIFVIAINKQIQPYQIISKVEEALISWNPHPLRLMYSNARNTIEEFGIIQSDDNNDNQKYASWLYYVLKNKELNKNIENDLFDLNKRLLDEYNHQIIPELNLFSKNVLESLKIGGETCSLKEFFKVNLDVDKNLLFQALNQFISCEMVLPEHLGLGTILKYNSDKPEQEAYWLCLSNACDLTPNQPMPWEEEEDTSEFKPFTAVKLIKEIGLTTPLKDITTKRYLFFEQKAFKFSKSKNPHYQTFYASNKGNIINEKLIVHTVKIIKETPTVKEEVFQVIAQLRLPFAQEFLQQLCNFQSRIGIDYVKSF
ncbi:MAG: hypothetical protein PF518_10255, partial [Spirochaetaceae bacterium]|nr:hypothetical protein [Spirochaetaceae bacterium]